MTVVVLTGPTCSGKTTIETELAKLGLSKVISHTTRAPRACEVDGQHYHFVDDGEFSRLKRAGEFVETVDFSGTRYGKSRSALAHAVTQGHVVTVLEPTGARALRAYCADNSLRCVGVWVDCTAQAQAERFLARYAETAQRPETAQRLAEMLSVEQDWRDSRCKNDYSLSVISDLMPLKSIIDRIVQFL